jgi:hypothetical protein
MSGDLGIRGIAVTLTKSRCLNKYHPIQGFAMVGEIEIRYTALS